MNKNQLDPKHFRAFIWDLMKKLIMMEKVTYNTGISHETQIAVVVWPH